MFVSSSAGHNDHGTRGPLCLSQCDFGTKRPADPGQAASRIWAMLAKSDATQGMPSSTRVHMHHVNRESSAWIPIITSRPLKIPPFLLVDLLISDGALFRAEQGPQTPVKHRIDRTMLAMFADQFGRRRHVGERGLQGGTL
jgi:hypothetical protein